MTQKSNSKFTFYPKNENRTKLIKACLYNDYKQIIYLVETEKVDLDCIADDGKTPLMYAIYNKNMDIAKYLCSKGADKNALDAKNNTALNYAITLAPEIALYLITQGVNIHIKNICNESSIHFAAMQGDLVIIQMLCEQGIELNDFNTNKHSPLMMACGNKHLKAVKYLIKKGANINATDNNYDSILHGCIHNDMYDILLFLLNNKNNKMINDKNYKNETPLIYAVKLKKIKYAELLLKYGAKPNVNDTENCVPLIQAIKDNQYEMCELLLKYGADPNIYFSYFEYNSALFHSMKSNDPKLMQLCLDHNANDLMFCYIEMNNYKDLKHLLNKDNINSKNSNGETLLYFASRKNKIEFVKILLENNADPNICNIKEQNESPLYHAVMNRNYEMIQLLIKYNANFNHRLTVFGFMGNKLGESILGKAERYCLATEICGYLKNLGAELFYEWD
jgi:ankyrin repeat protein